MKKSAFTLVELMVVITILGILVAIIVPVVSNAIKTGRETACRQNLKVIGDAMHQYAQDYKRLPGIESTGALWHVIGSNNNDPSTSLINDGTRPLFMLMWVCDGAGGRTEVDYVSPKAFVCPAVDWAQEDPLTVPNQVGFGSYKSISYSYQHQTRVTTTGFSLSRLGAASRVILADKNPMNTYSGVSGNNPIPTSQYYLEGSSGRPATSNSENHGRRGQNILRLGGSVDWVTTPVVGAGNDNIWIPTGYAGTYGAADHGLVPVDRDDIMLVP